MKSLLHPRRALALALALSVTAPALAETFTVAVVPDPQNYNDETQAQPQGVNTFIQQMQYLLDSRAERTLVFTTFVGDIVQHGDGNFVQKLDDGSRKQWSGHAEWDGAERAISLLDQAGIPFGMVPGNHDYDNAGVQNHHDPKAPQALAGGSTWEHYFGPQSKHFAGKSWYGGSFNQGMNSYQLFSAGGIDFLALSLEMEPTPAALDWAQQVLDSHPKLPVIVTTHAWLQPVSKPGAEQRGNWHDAYFAGTDHLPADQVWDRFIRRNRMIFLVLCGHDFTPANNGMSQGENLRVDHNDAGLPVYQVLQDYQGDTRGPDGQANSAHGGAGWLRFIEFDTEQHTLHFSTWSPLLGRYAGRNGEKTFGVDPYYSDFSVAFPPQLAPDPIHPPSHGSITR